MDPIIVDPSTYDKASAFSSALMYCDEFLKWNGIKPPKKIFTEPTSIAREQNAWRDYGWYEWTTGHMFVNVKGSRNPVKTPGFAWSFTGYKADLTAPGILAHEMGHHIHCVLTNDGSRKSVNDSIVKIFKVEPNVSSYEPNLYEKFAEACRLFILNPDLLRQGRPARYNFMTITMGLKPIHDATWRDVLVNAHPRIISAAENWIKNAL